MKKVHEFAIFMPDQAQTIWKNSENLKIRHLKFEILTLKRIYKES